VIREIDHSKEVLHNIISKLEDKKNVLEEIEQQIEDTSMTLLSSIEFNKSSFKEEHTEADSSSRVERTQVQEITNRPRASGARISPQKIIHEMEMSQEIETGLLSQGALGSPKDQHSGAPDAAGSIVHGRKSCEGTAEADLGSASAEQVATVETDPFTGAELTSCTHEDADPSTCAEMAPISNTREKRKASSSPGSEIADDAGVY